MNLKPWAKAIIAGVGTAATAATVFVAPDSTAGKAAAVTLFVLTTFGVWRVPNARPVPVTLGPVK